MHKKFFQLRQMTRNLDGSFCDDLYSYEHMMEQTFTPIQSRRDNDKRLLRQWNQYKIGNMQRIIEQTIESRCFKICICDFTEDKQNISFEFWIKVAYDVFYDEVRGREIRGKFWRHLRHKSQEIEHYLSKRKWPRDWRYLREEQCLNLELIKLYEQYMAIRPYIAEMINQMTKIQCDIRRMPLLKEDKAIRFEAQKNCWFPQIDLCSSQILKQLSYTDNYFCEQLSRFIIKMKPIVYPLLYFFKLDNHKGRVVHIYGQNHDFILEILYSLKACCGTSINLTQNSLKLKKNYKSQNSYKMNEYQCCIMLTTMQQSDITEDVIQDLQSNVSQGYQAFTTQYLEDFSCSKSRLIFIISEKELIINNVKHIKHQIPDEDIFTLKQTYDYQFLQYYANVMFDKCMIVQQNCSSRKPFYQIMLCLWTYILPTFFADEIPDIQFRDLKHNEVIQNENYYNLESDSNVEIIEIKKQKKIEKNNQSIIQIDDDDDECMIVDQPKKIIKL